MEHGSDWRKVACSECRLCISIHSHSLRMFPGMK